MQPYPLLSHLKAPPSLCPQLHTILLACGHVAAGDAAAAVAAFAHIAPPHRPKAYELALVQAAPLVGVPRVLHSAAALHAAGVYRGPSHKPAGAEGDAGVHGRRTDRLDVRHHRQDSRHVAQHAQQLIAQLQQQNQQQQQQKEEDEEEEEEKEEEEDTLFMLPPAPTDPGQLREAGRHTFDAVYARNADRVAARLRTMHPDLCDWILDCVYGRLYSRLAPGPDPGPGPAVSGSVSDTSNGSSSIGAGGDFDPRQTPGADADHNATHPHPHSHAPNTSPPPSSATLSLRERELAIVATLAVDPVAAVQLASHLRGALNAGATGDEIRAVVQQTRVTNRDAADSAEAVFATFQRARYAL